MTFVEVRDDLLRTENLHPPSDEREPLHSHPKQKSGAELLSGSLVFEVDGKRCQVGPGESIEIPAKTPHRFWNESGEEAQSMQFFEPALGIASFFETFFILAQEDKLDEKGMPSILQLAVMVPEFSDEIRPASPPWPVLRAMTTLLAPIARARGYKTRLSSK